MPAASVQHSYQYSYQHTPQTSVSLPRLRGEHGAKGHQWRERVGEVERVGVDATLGLAEQTVHLVRVRVGVRIWVW